MSKIRTFEEFSVEERQLFEITDAYNAGVAEAKAFYEREGKVKESTSNRSFFINEPKN